MSEFSYLVAIALIEQSGNRLMPLGGKSLKAPLSIDNRINEDVKTITLELLLRVMERTEEATVRRINSEESLLLLEISMEIMQTKLPILKAEWIQTGNTEIFLKELKKICNGIWSLNFIRYEGLKINKL